MRFRFLQVIFILIFFASCRGGKDASDLRSRVREIRLENGMTFLLLKREGAPVFSAQLNVRVGGLEDPPGGSGLAHFFEHMAFKGTDKLGSKDFSLEKPILDEVLDVGTRLTELAKSGRPESELAPLREKLRALEAEENRFIVKNEFFNALSSRGAVDLNAMTNSDMTMYIASLPSNKLELWAYWESQRLTRGVLREFFAERDVVAEERRMSVDNSPNGKLYEAVLTNGFSVSPYRKMTIGFPEDVRNFTPAQAKAFYEKYYVPSRMAAALVGNFDLEDAEAVIRRYFAPMPKRETPAETFPAETFDTALPRRVTVQADAEPRLILGYHRPAWPHPDDAALEALESVLCEGETSRLNERLLYKDQIAVVIDCTTAFPGDRLPSLFVIHVVPATGRSNAEASTAVREEIAKLGQEGPSQFELEKALNQYDADLVYSMTSNDGLAYALAYYQTLTGDWRDMYAMRDSFAKVTASDVRRVIASYFVPAREIEVDLETASDGGGR